MSTEPKLTLSLQLDLHGLVPDPHEFDPSLAHYVMFGEGRFPNKIALTPEQQTGHAEVTLSSYTLPPLNELRGDEHILFHIVPRTRLSGMPELDATEGKYATRDKLGGSFVFSLARLLESAQKRTPIASMPIEDPYLYESILSEKNSLTPKTMADAHFGATKGTLKQLSVTVTPPEAASTYATRIRALVDASERDSTQPLLLGTRRFAEEQRKSLDSIARHYNAFFGGPDARFPNAYDRICGVLHMPFWTATMGDTLPLAFFAARDHPRLQPPKANYVGNPRYDVSEETLAFYEAAARSTYASVGLSPEGAKKALIAQWKSTRTDALEPLTPRLIDGAMRTLQAFGNNVKYRSDDRTPNRAWLASRGPNAPMSYSGAKHARAKRLLTKHGGRFCGGGGGGGGEDPIERPNESMDDLSHSGILDANDCEDDEKPALSVASEIEPLDPQFALNPKRLEKYPLLQATARILQRYDLLGTGAAAKSPYLDTSKPKAEVKYDFNGHIYGIGHSRVLAAELIKRGGTGDVWATAPAYFDRLDLEGRVTREIAPFEALLPSVTIEGTSPGATFIQPPEEIGQHWAASVEASRKVYDNVLRLGAPPDAPKEYESAIAKLFAPRQLPERAVKNGNMSNFYHAPIHAISERLAALDPRLAHFNYVDMHTRTRGVPVEQVMRARPGDASSTIALVSPYADATDDELKSIYDVAAVIKNTQPAPAMTRFPTIDRTAEPHSVVPDFATATLRLGHPLSDASFAAMSHLRLPEYPPPAVWKAFTRALDNHSFGLRRAAANFGATKTDAKSASAVAPAGIEKLAPHLDREDRTVYSFFAPAWAVANADMARIDHELAELYEKGLVIDHAIWRDRFLQHCDDQITLALVVPVA